MDRAKSDVDALGASPEKGLKKAERHSEFRQLDQWERYRALNDLLDSYIDMIELADRKARIALLILGALNALNLVFVSRPQFAVTSVSPRSIGIYAAVYIVASLFLLTRTIGVLRSRAGVFLRGRSGGMAAPRVRFIGDVVRQTKEQYYEGWQKITIGELNEELSSHVHNLAAIIVAKYRALDHLYHGLVALAVLTSMLVATIIVIRLPG